MEQEISKEVKDTEIWEQAFQDPRFKEPMLRDAMLADIYEEYITNGHPPTQGEAISMMQFFGIFSLGCRRLGCNEVADAMSKRLTWYVMLLNIGGYKFGHRTTWRKRLGLEDLMERAFATSKLGVGGAHIRGG